MSEAEWEFVAALAASGRNDAGQDGVGLVGTLRGTAPASPTAVTLYVGGSAIDVDGAELQPIELLGHDRFGLFLPGLRRGAAPPGSVVRPRSAAPPAPPPTDSAWLFGRRKVALSVRHTVALDPDYGGVLFRTDSGMAPIDYFAAHIPADVQSALRDWYGEWDESTTTDRWTEEEWVAEGHRLAATLQTVMGDDWDIYFDP